MHGNMHFGSQLSAVSHAKSTENLILCLYQYSRWLAWPSHGDEGLKVVILLFGKIGIQKGEAKLHIIKL